MSLNLISQNNSKNTNNNSISLVTVILGFINRSHWKIQSIWLQIISENLKENKSPRWYFRMIAYFFWESKFREIFRKILQKLTFCSFMVTLKKKFRSLNIGITVYRDKFNGYKSIVPFVHDVKFTKCNFRRLKINLICNFTLYRKTTECLEIVFIKGILEKRKLIKGISSKSSKSKIIFCFSTNNYLSLRYCLEIQILPTINLHLQSFWPFCVKAIIYQLLLLYLIISFFNLSF